MKAQAKEGKQQPWLCTCSAWLHFPPPHAASLRATELLCRAASPSHMPPRTAGKTQHKIWAHSVKFIYLKLVNAFCCCWFFFFDTTTLTQQTNKGHPAAPWHMATLATALQVPAAGPDAHLHLESRDQVKEKGRHFIQETLLVWKVDLAYSLTIMPCFKSHWTLESKYYALLLIGRKKYFFN